MDYLLVAMLAFAILAAVLMAWRLAQPSTPLASRGESRAPPAPLRDFTCDGA
jgi:hypothetical protein